MPDITNYTMAGRTYRYYSEDPLYPFGYGLSYTTFMYTSLGVTPPGITAGDSVTAQVELVNNGQYDADEVRRGQPKVTQCWKLSVSRHHS